MNEIKDHTKNLCETCSRSCVTRGQTLRQEFIRCGWLEREITFRVSECSRYKSRNEKDLDDHTRIAWLIDTTKGNIGFVRPKDLTPDQKDELNNLG